MCHVGTIDEIKNSGEDLLRLLNTSEGKDVEKNIVANRNSEHFCKSLPGGR
jgi:hypothetical protein